MEDVLIPLGFFGSIVLIVYLSQRHKQRKMLISMGQPLEQLNVKEFSNSLDSLKIGLVSIAIALGIFAGYFLARYSDLLEEAAYFSMIFLFGGIALLIFHFIAQGKMDKTK
jgi:hypothetical protein